MANIPQDQNYQMLVLGAGPSGCAAAITASLGGMNVAIIERSEFPRDRPGEALHPGMRPLLAQLGVERETEERNFVAFEGIWREVDGKRTLTRFGPKDDPSWLGIQAIRSEFDSLLLNRAISVGVKLLQPVKALSAVLGAGGEVLGLETSIGKIHSRFVIDAGGGNHWLARRLGNEIQNHSPLLIAHYGYKSSCPIPDTQLPMIRNQADGWTWHAKIDKNCYQWVAMSFEGTGNNISRERNSRSSNVTWRRAETLAGAGFFLAGDAAVVVDPASSHGVLRAVMSGIMSAHAAQKIHKTPSVEKQLVHEYCEWLSSWFTHEVDRLSEMYLASSKPPSWLKDREKPLLSSNFNTP